MRPISETYLFRNLFPDGKPEVHVGEPNNEPYCLLDSLRSAVSALAGQEFDMPEQFKKKRLEQATYAREHKLKGRKLFKTDDAWVKGLVSEIQNSDTPIGKKLSEYRIDFCEELRPDQIDELLAAGHQVIVAFNSHLAHIRQDESPNLYYSMSDKRTVHKMQVWHMRPTGRSFNAIVLSKYR